jgi:hypothetical protein
MKRIIIGSILIGIFTALFIVDILEDMRLLEIGISALVWYGLTGWMIFAGYKSLKRNKAGELK